MPMRISESTRRISPGSSKILPARILIQDIAYALRDYSAHIEADPRELERLQSRLAELDISVNVVAALHHDHLFVPWDRREEALECLRDLETKQ